MWAREMSQASPTKEHRSDDDHLPKPVVIVISLVHTNPFHGPILTIKTIAPFSPTVSKKICVTG
jgi:hypothetical protein